MHRNLLIGYVMEKRHIWAKYRNLKWKRKKSLHLLIKV